MGKGVGTIHTQEDQINLVTTVIVERKSKTEMRGCLFGTWVKWVGGDGGRSCLWGRGGETGE